MPKTRKSNRKSKSQRRNKRTQNKKRSGGHVNANTLKLWQRRLSMKRGNLNKFTHTDVGEKNMSQYVTSPAPYYGYNQQNNYGASYY